MKAYVHARLNGEERTALENLSRSTGKSTSDIVRRGLRLAFEESRGRPSALDVAGDSVGRFKNGPRDLSTNPDHLEGFGK